MARKYKICSYDNCSRQVCYVGYCSKHLKIFRPDVAINMFTCKVSGCFSYAKRDRLCNRHNPNKICKFPQCLKYSIGNELCSRHGGKRKRCSVGYCKTWSDFYGLCWIHYNIKCKNIVLEAVNEINYEFSIDYLIDTFSGTSNDTSNDTT
jgi:hypothetical protein